MKRVALFAASLAVTVACQNKSESTAGRQGLGAGASADASAKPSDSPLGGCGVPTSFQWSSTGPIIAPMASNLSSIKDPTVVFFNNVWNVYASTADTGGSYNSVYLSFADWSQAGSAPQHPLQGGVAPQVFYFAPQNLWYRVYEWPDVYDTNTDPTQWQNWSPRKTFYATTPAIVKQNQGSGGMIDFKVICDSANCFLFFSDDNGHLYRAQTPIKQFPTGFGQPVIVMTAATPSALYESSNVYKIKGISRYLLLVECYDDPAGRRYYKSWTADALDGAWTPLQNTYSAPFASAANVTFGGTPWTQDISHGEMLRAGYDQNIEIDTCNMKYLYMGRDPSSGGSYDTLPWRLGLLTKTN